MKPKTWIVALAVAGMVACGGEEEGERVPLGQQEQQERAPLPGDVQARVDSGNTAYAAGNYQEAADIFQAVADDHPDLSVGWFGLYMAHTELGNEQAAQDALAQVEEISPGLAPMHQAARDSQHMDVIRGGGMGQMPSGHPGMPEGHPQVDTSGGD